MLFLDELAEFSRHVLDVLRQPLESGLVTISRAARSADFPARFQLICAMNPCPCGHFGDGTERCACTPSQRARYGAKVSGPLLDRLDLLVETLPWTADIDREKPIPEEDTETVATRVAAGRAFQDERQGTFNARLTPPETERHCTLGKAERALMHRAARRLELSARSHHRVLRVARTIADLVSSECISRTHLLEALSLPSTGEIPGMTFRSVTALRSGHDAAGDTPNPHVPAFHRTRARGGRSGDCPRPR